MKNIYNKGDYRDRLWVKHLSPFMKKICNRKWRRTAGSEIKTRLKETEADIEKPDEENRSSLMR